MVEVLDVEFVGRDADGRAVGVTAAALSASSGTDLRIWDGASSGLLDGDDLSEVAAAIAQDSVAAVVITVIVLVLWLILFVLWFVLGIPLGPGYPVAAG